MKEIYKQGVKRSDWRFTMKVGRTVCEQQCMCDVRSTALAVGSPSYEGDLPAWLQHLTVCASDQTLEKP